MNYVSLFSGIEAASVAWGPLGWTPVAFAEIEPFCCDLLAKRFPEVPNLGNVSGVDWTEYEGSVDVVIGGSPCQAFSLAGRRLGLMDERGQLMLEFVRCVREAKPRWVIWENVPGVLSQDRGRAFGTLLGGAGRLRVCSRVASAGRSVLRSTPEAEACVSYRTSCAGMRRGSTF